MLNNVTAPNRLDMIDLAWHLFLKDLVDPESSLSKIQRTDPVYAEMISDMFRLHADTHIQTSYVIHAKRLGIPDLGNLLHHSRIAAMADSMGGELEKGKYKSRGSRLQERRTDTKTRLTPDTIFKITGETDKGAAAARRYCVDVHGGIHEQRVFARNIQTRNHVYWFGSGSAAGGTDGRCVETPCRLETSEHRTA